MEHRNSQWWRPADRTRWNHCSGSPVVPDEALSSSQRPWSILSKLILHLTPSHFQSGFNGGDVGLFFNLPGSRSNDVVNIEQTTNVNSPGRWVFRIDTELIDPANGCSYNGKCCSPGPLFQSPADVLVGTSLESTMLCSFSLDVVSATVLPSFHLCSVCRTILPPWRNLLAV